MKKIISILVVGVILIASMFVGCGKAGMMVPHDTPPPPQLSPQLEQRIIEDYRTKYDIDSNDTVNILHYFGTYNDCVVVVLEGGERDSLIRQEVAGWTFRFTEYNHIDVWCDGEFIDLKDAYMSDMIDIFDTAQIYLQHSGEYEDEYEALFLNDSISIYSEHYYADYMGDEKRYSTFTIEDDFATDTINVVLSRQKSWEQDFFTPDDFPEVKLAEVIDLDVGGREKIVNQQAALNLIEITAYELLELTSDPVAWNEIIQTLPNEILSGGMRLWLINPESYRKSLSLKLKNPSKKNVLSAIKELEKRDDILSAGVNGVYSIKN